MGLAAQHRDVGRASGVLGDQTAPLTQVGNRIRTGSVPATSGQCHLVGVLHQEVDGVINPITDHPDTAGGQRLSAHPLFPAGDLVVEFHQVTAEPLTGTLKRGTGRERRLPSTALQDLLGTRWALGLDVRRLVGGRGDAATLRHAARQSWMNERGHFALALDDIDGHRLGGEGLGSSAVEESVHEEAARRRHLLNGFQHGQGVKNVSHVGSD
ncbi:hypothetical protein D3C76_1113030 [compost metagenome]